MRYGWSKFINDWKAPDGMPKPEEWKVVPFNKQYKHMLPYKSGVYMVFMTSPYNNTQNLSYKAPIYIGRTNNLCQRFQDHTKTTVKKNLFRKLQENLDFNINTNINNINFCFAIIDKIDKLKTYEDYLIIAYGPCLNQINSIAKGATKRKIIKAKIIRPSN